MNAPQIAGLILGDQPHYLDHIGPFCALSRYPLILSEPSLASIAREYYPGLQVEEIPWPAREAPQIIVSCHPRPILKAAFPFATLQTRWLPHGNSDKGWKSAVFEQLCHEETVLAYGAKMIDSIQEKSGASHLRIEKVGNFRKAYFEKHKEFYRSLVEQTFPSRAMRTFLYAPTWDDTEGNCSFWDAFPILAKHLPEDYALLVKPHPNTLKAFTPQIERWIGKYRHKTNIIWVTDWLPIYALLDICDGYIGDMSSVGYDFLSFNRPMYFLNHQKQKDTGLYLYRCGLELMPEQYKDLFRLDREMGELDQTRFHKIREDVYKQIFYKIIY